MSNRPRRHSEPEFLAYKKAQIDARHVAPLNAMVRRIQDEHDGVPFFDPGDGGTNARVLLLLEAPGPEATNFVSCDNDDQTAENTFNLLADARLARCEIVVWNVVPFYIGKEDRSKLRAARQTDLDAGRPWLVELIGLLPRLDTVVLLGRSAQRAEPLIRQLNPDLRILNGWHPSPVAMNRYPTRRPELLAVLRQASNRS